MYHYFIYTALFLGIIPLVVLVSKKRALDFNIPILPFIWLTFIASVYEFVGTSLLGVNTSYWFQTYSLLEFLCIYYFFYSQYRSSYKKILTVFLAILVLTYGTSFIFWRDNQLLVSEAINRIPIALFIFTFSFIWIKELFNKMVILNPWQHPTFYFISALSIYYAATTFLFVLSSFIFESKLYFYDYWMVNIMATFILRLLVIIGVWKMKTN